MLQVWRDEQRKQQKEDMSFSEKFQKDMVMCNRATGVTRRTDGRTDLEFDASKEKIG